MNEWLIDVAFLLVSLMLLASGLIALLLPSDKYLRLLKWWTGPAAWFQPGSDGDKRPRFDVGRRLAGLGLALMGATFFSAEILSVLRRMLEAKTRATAVVRLGADAPPNWLAFSVGCAVLAFGLYVIFKPQKILLWAMKRLPFQGAVSERTVHPSLLAMRIMGGIIVYASIDLFRAWLRG